METNPFLVFKTMRPELTLYRNSLINNIIQLMDFIQQQITDENMSNASVCLRILNGLIDTLALIPTEE